MSLTPLGSMTVGDAVPGVQIAVGASLPNLQAQLAGLIAAQFDITAHPPTIAGNLAIAQAIVASLQAQIALGVEVPTASLQLAAIATAIAAIQGQLTALLALEAALGQAGVFGYIYSGPTNGLGGDLTAELAAGFPGGGPTDASNAIILATSVAPAWVALEVVLVNP